VLVFIAGAFCIKAPVSDYAAGVNAENGAKALPHYDEVRKIIEPLRYSGLQMLERPDVSLGFDFNNKTWTLYNLHRFDAAGNLILEDGKSGTCGELAAYTYKYVRPLFDDGYDIKFAKVLQSGYFLSPKTTHIALYIIRKAGLLGKDKVYIIDPSFHKCGPISDFEDYMFLDVTDELDFVDQKKTDITLPVFNQVPLLIKKDYLMGFVVEDNGGVFDENNYTIALTLTKKYNFAGRYVFALRNNNGRKEEFENKILVQSFLSEEEYLGIRKSIESLFAEGRMR
jgi:hypothetical protein